MQILNRLVRSPKVLEHFRPNQEEMNKLQLSKLITSEEKESRELGLDLMSYLMKHCKHVEPVNLLERDFHSLAMVQHINQLAQWDQIDKNAEKTAKIQDEELRDAKARLDALEESLENVIEQRGRLMGQMKKTDMKAHKTEELQHKLEEEQERVRLALGRVEKRVAGAPDAPLNVLQLRVDTLWDLVKSIDLSR